MRWRKVRADFGKRWRSGDYTIHSDGDGRFMLECPRFRYGWKYFTEINRAMRYARIHHERTGGDA